MPWIRRAIAPLHLSFGEDGLTFDPGLVVETRQVDDLAVCSVWALAPLTRIARREVPRLLREAWHVRRPGMTDPLTVVLRLQPHLLYGRVPSRAPARATIARGDRPLVVQPDLVLTVHGSDPSRALGLIADGIEGTRRRPRLRARPAPGPAADLDALTGLAR